jgi:hypothetical protein
MSNVNDSARRAGVTIIDAYHSIIECNECGRRWGALYQSGGRYCRGWRACPEGCNQDRLSNRHAGAGE